MGQAASRQEAFWEACGFGHVKRVEKFIEEGIDVNWVSYTHDCCPIHVASQGKPEIVDLLLKQNCDVNVLDIRGNTPLHHAAMKGHSDIMQTLITAGCKIDTEDKNGWTALHNAAYWCHYKAVKVLLKSRCDITVRNKDSRTALHEVARSKEKEEETLGEIARHLIEAGSDINARGSDLGEADFTGLMFASYHGHTEVASAFIEAGCDINATGSSNNWSALHWAADRERDAMVYLLLEAGIDPTIKAYRGETAADRAKSPEIKETILNAINMFEELKILDSKCPPAQKNTSYSQSQSNSPNKNKLTNQMVDNIFSRIPPMRRPEPTKPEVKKTLELNSKPQNKTEDSSKVTTTQESSSNESACKDLDFSESTNDNASSKNSKSGPTNDSSSKIESTLEQTNQIIENSDPNSETTDDQTANQIAETSESTNQPTANQFTKTESTNQRVETGSAVESANQVEELSAEQKQELLVENSTKDENNFNDDVNKLSADVNPKSAN